MDFGKKPKHENPRTNANPISQLFFLWITPLLWKGMRNGLTTDDLSKCLQKDKSHVLGDNLEREWNRELVAAMEGKRKSRLWRPMYRLFARQFFIDGISQYINALINCLMPLVFSQFLIQFQKPFVPENTDTEQSAIPFNTSSRIQVNESFTTESQKYELFQKVSSLVDYAWNDVYCLAFLLISLVFAVTFFLHHTKIRLILLGARLRIACCSLIYRKSLRLSASAANRTGQGYLVNLLTNDVARFDMVLCYANYICILPPQSILIGYLLWRRIRWAAVVGVIGLLLKTVPVQTRLGHYAMVLRKKIAERTDKRIGIMNEIVEGIQVIKMYAWEIPFHKLVSEARRLEIKQIQYSSYIRMFTLSLQIFVGRSTLFISIATCILTGQIITPDIVFSMAQYLQVVRLIAANLYPLGVSYGAEALISLRRIEEFLLEEEKSEEETNVKRRNSVITINEKENAIEINNLSASWDQNSNSNTLNQIDLKIKAGQVCAIAGPVGGGKSSLIQILLGELPVQLGNVIVNGSVSYAAQEPWIFSGTVRDNILFGQTYDKIRYNKVTKSCALISDFEQWPNGDKTIVGERGASLSGGQRARISLARAMYKPAAIYLLDDPLSAVDAHVGKQLFDQVIGPKAKIAKNATKIIVTHQIHFLNEADLIVIMDNGKITDRGDYAELSNRDIDFTKLLQKVEEEDENNGKTPHPDIFGDNGQMYVDDDDIPYIDDVSNGTPYKALRRFSKLSSKLSSRSSIVSDQFNTDLNEKEEEIKRGIPLTAFSHYFLAGATRCGILFSAFVFVLLQIILSGTDYFLKFWTQEEFKREHNENVRFTSLEYLYMYSGLTFCVIFISMTRSTLFLTQCMRASKVLHNRMFNSILHAPMRFFETNQSGRILNRFSKDIGSIDETLPNSLLISIQRMLDLLGILIIVISLNRIMIIVLLVAVLICSFILKLYVRASQDLKRLEGICRSPVLSHLTATMDGLATIRSRNVQTELCHEFDELQNVHSSVWQLTMTSLQAFGFWIDFLCCIFVACVTFSFVVLYDNTFSGNVGLAISQALDLTGMVQFGMRQVTETMQQMTNVERIVQYIDLEPEHSPAKKAPVNWPRIGKIDVKNMSLRYGLGNEPTLKNISLEIPSGFKIGCVGRTGAGKSSLIAALFRLTHIDGIIEIDDIDTGTISLGCLRSKISIIPQNPVLFSGTLRKNLDPFEEYTDDDIWKSLESVQLKESASLAEGLNMTVLVHGKNFSVGQRQLICLARAILRNNRILVLDEATANVDPQTDDLIQKTIRKQFANCTVLTVAHRLPTIIDSDRVLVMDAGRVVEYDQPLKLLQADDGVFHGMVKALGSNEFIRLKNLAKKNC